MRCKDTSIGGTAFFGAGFFLKRYTGSVQFTQFFVVFLFCCPFILIGWEFGIPDFPMDCENPPYIGIVYSLRMLNAVQVEMWQIHRLQRKGKERFMAIKATLKVNPPIMRALWMLMNVFINHQEPLPRAVVNNLSWGCHLLNGAFRICAIPQCYQA